MTTDKLSMARKNFLEALSDPQIETALLREMLNEKELKTLLVAYVADENHEPIKTGSAGWSVQYFSQQKKLAERNFSSERLEHLIEVRERFRQEGRKGFVPKPPAASPNPPLETEAGFSPSSNLRKFVEEGDITTVRTALSVELEDSRLDHRALRSALAWVKARLPDLFDPYSEKAFARGIERDHKLWSADYYNKQLVYLDTNFAEERFIHLIEVREHLRQQTPAASGPVIKPGPTAMPRPVFPHEGAQPSATPQAHQSVPTTNRHGLSPALRTALMIGGALAAVVILILALRK